MELYTVPKEYTGVSVVIDTFGKISKSGKEDVASAIRLLRTLCGNSNEARFSALIEKAAAMCRQMEPEVGDVVSLLLYKEYKLNRATFTVFGNTFRANRARHYFERTAEAVSRAPQREGFSADENIEYYIMLRVCDKMFESMMRTLNKKKISNAIVISNAYFMAKKQCEKLPCDEIGIPPLAGSLCAARFLAEEGVDSTVVAAALAHRAYFLPEAGKAFYEKCGSKVAETVEMASNTEKRRGEFSGTAPIEAVLVLAAEMIHRLRAADMLPSEKSHALMDEALLIYLPMLKACGMGYYSNIIDDLVRRAGNIGLYEKIKADYLDMVNRNSEHIIAFERVLTDCLGDNFNKECRQRFGTADCNIQINKREYLPGEVMSFLKEAGVRTQTARAVRKSNVPLCDFDAVLECPDECDGTERFAAAFLKIFLKNTADTKITVTNYYSDDDGSFTVKAEDGYLNSFRIRFIMSDDYAANRFGHKNVFVEKEENDGEKIGDGINVILRNGKVIELPRGATVIDVAFAIHEEVGFSARSALINGQRALVYNTVQDGDKVIVEADTYRVNGVTKKYVPHVKIYWLDCVATKKARRKIIRFLCNKYNEKDERIRVDAVSDAYVNKGSNPHAELLRNMYLVDAN